MNKKYQWVCLLVASYAFYMWASVKYVVFLIFATLNTFLIGLCIQRYNDQYADALLKCEKSEKKEIKKQYNEKKKKVLTFGILINFAVLTVVKYANFLIGNVNDLFAILHVDASIGFLNIILPMGISFYTFQTVGYLIDLYRGKIKADTNILRFALFVSYFPQIIQGPISRHGDLAHQLFEEHSFDYDRVKFGLQRVFWGFFKKLVVAERTAIFVNTVFGEFYDKEFAGLTVFIAVLLYGVQIYADFSGGMDIVFGVSQMFGISLVENFRRPFMAKSVSEFWQRWHISLSSWMRDYVFYPLALSAPFNSFGKKLRKLGLKYSAKVIPTCLASFIVFLLIGIWHGANWKYLAFGLYSAFFVSSATLFEPFYTKSRTFFRVDPERLSFRLFQVIRTVFLVTLGRYFSRAETLKDAINMLRATFSTWNPWVLFDGSLYELGLSQKNFSVMLVMIFVLFVIDWLQEKGYPIRETLSKQGIVFRWICYYAVLFMILIFGVYGPGYNASNFIYQGF